MSRLAPSEDPTSLGRILLDADIISVRQLNEGVAFALANDRLLGQALLDLGYLNESSLQSAIEVQKAQRASTPHEAKERTLGLMQGATANAASAIERMQSVVDRADAIVRQFRVRRQTGGT